MASSACSGPSMMRTGSRIATGLASGSRRTASRVQHASIAVKRTQPGRSMSSGAFAPTSRRRNEEQDSAVDTTLVTPDPNAPPLHIAPLASVDLSLFRDVRPQPRAAYVALAHRLKLISTSTPEDVKNARIDKLVQACTHPSYGSLLTRVRAKYGDKLASAGAGRGIVRDPSRDLNDLESSIDGQYVAVDPSRHNAVLATLGNSLMGLAATESLHLRYPNLPNRILKAAVSAYVGSTTLSDIAAELGVTAQGMVRWDREAMKVSTKKGRPAGRLLAQDVNADVMRSITALIFQEQGLAAARDFVHTRMLSRLIPLLSLLKFNDPKRTLVELCRKTGMDRPQSRMIAETGRLSINPIFVVGVWSGEQKLGEGTGSAIRMAEYRAAEDALRRFYMSETAATSISLPSTTLDLDFAPASADDAPYKDIWQVGQDVAARAAPPAPFQPAPLGSSEIVFGSKA